MVEKAFKPGQEVNVRRKTDARVFDTWSESLQADTF
jgi:hypothetical protein